MIPCFFGPSDTPLFGAFDPAVTPRLRRAVLILNPGGWEYVRAHRTLRFLASRLAAVGIDVMRFDYSGTGDSWGDRNSAITLERWIADVEEAADELMALSGVTRVGMVGLRMGARIALESARRDTLPCDRLVLWDPIDIGTPNDDTSSMHVPDAVCADLTRADRVREVRAGVSMVFALSDGSGVPEDLRVLRPTHTLQHAGSAACWVEEQDFGAGAVPTRLLEDIVAWLRS